MAGLTATIRREDCAVGETHIAVCEDRSLFGHKRQHPKSSKASVRRTTMSSVTSDVDDVFTACDVSTRAAVTTKRPQSAWNSRVRRPHFSTTDLDSGCEDKADIEVLYLDERYALSSESSADGGNDDTNSDSSVPLVSAWDDASSGTHCRRASDVLKLDVGWCNRICEKEQEQQQASQPNSRHEQPQHRRAASLKAQTSKNSRSTDEIPRRRISSESDKIRTKVNASKDEWKHGNNHNQQASISQLARDFACGQVAENVLARCRQRTVSDVSQQQSPILSLNANQRTSIVGGNPSTLPHAPRKLKPLYPKAKAAENTDAISKQKPLALPTNKE